jgi:hypothetical protein
MLIIKRGQGAEKYTVCAAKPPLKNMTCPPPIQTSLRVILLVLIKASYKTPSSSDTSNEKALLPSLLNGDDLIPSDSNFGQPSVREIT